MNADGTGESMTVGHMAPENQTLRKRRSISGDRRLRAGVLGLTNGEHFVVWVFRTWLEGPASRLALDAAFQVHCGVFNAESAAECFARLVDTLATHSRRTLGFHRAECMAVSASERTLLALIAAAQVGNMDYASAVAEWLVPRNATPGLVLHATTFAFMLEVSGLRLPLRVAQPVPVAECV